ncbi:hypothetical protein MKEN_00922900 [Mycena kentingensis (nom. inval.)]|nr:hypothetical protein MKEN_00922900 [Mycena kentingensis (nom. inval.)]
MPLEIEVSFTGHPAQNFAAKRWSTPEIQGPFSALPAENNSLTIPNDGLFVNSIGPDVRRVLSLREFREWGITDEDEKRIVYARAQAGDGTTFCLRFILNARRAAHKRSPNYVRLLKDADNYVKFGRAAAGIILPVCYGMWVMETGDFAGTVLFIMSQWCGETWKSLMGTQYDTEANRVLIGRTLEVLHDVGLAFDGIVGSNKDFTHILLDIHAPNIPITSKADGNARCFIAGLSNLVQHQCQRRLPVLPLGAHIPSQEFGCRELRNCAVLLGFLLNTLPPANPIIPKPAYLLVPERQAFAKSAIAWLTSYPIEDRPVPPIVLRMAQRQLHFPTYPPLYTGLSLSMGDLVVQDALTATRLSPDTLARPWSRAELASRFLRVGDLMNRDGYPSLTHAGKNGLAE